MVPALSWRRSRSHRSPTRSDRLGGGADRDEFNRRKSAVCKTSVVKRQRRVAVHDGSCSIIRTQRLLHVGLKPSPWRRVRIACDQPRGAVPQPGDAERTVFPALFHRSWGLMFLRETSRAAAPAGKSPHLADYGRPAGTPTASGGRRWSRGRSSSVRARPDHGPGVRSGRLEVGGVGPAGFPAAVAAGRKTGQNLSARQLLRGDGMLRSCQHSGSPSRERSGARVAYHLLGHHRHLPLTLRPHGRTGGRWMAAGA